METDKKSTDNDFGIETVSDSIQKIFNPDFGASSLTKVKNEGLPHPSPGNGMIKAWLNGNGKARAKMREVRNALKEIQRARIV